MGLNHKKLKGKSLNLSGWGCYPISQALVYRPEMTSDMQGDFFAHMPLDGISHVIARGAGRSYGDQAQNTNQSVIWTNRLDRVLAFDDTTGIMVAESGIDFADLMRIFLPRGWIMPVQPGTGFVTLGGAIANDVHGKNHDQMGSFGHHVVWFDLLLPSGEVKRVSPLSDSIIFKATIGGCGLTGIILRVAVRLQKIASTKIDVTYRRMANLGEFIAALRVERDRAEAAADLGQQYYSVGWIDALAGGKSLGRGILEIGEMPPAPVHAQQFSANTVKPAKSFPINLPSFALNKLAVRGFNELYYRCIPRAGCQRRVNLVEFLWPLDAILHWNRLYGKRGFQQLQCVLPDDRAENALRAILSTSQKMGSASFLAVIKSLGSEGLGYLSFPMRGITLALDFPRCAGSDELFRALHRIIIDNGGRVYLAKDSALAACDLASMYPQLPQFRAARQEIDAKQLLSSNMARRLGL